MRRCRSCRPRRCAPSRDPASSGALSPVGRKMELHPSSGALSSVEGVPPLPVMMARRRRGAVSRDTELAAPSGALSPVKGVPPLPVMMARRRRGAVSRDTELAAPSGALSPVKGVPPLPVMMARRRRGASGTLAPVEGQLPPTAQHCAPWRRWSGRAGRVRYCPRPHTLWRWQHVCGHQRVPSRRRLSN
jgi:hypothetical protein